MLIRQVLGRSTQHSTICELSESLCTELAEIGTSEFYALAHACGPTAPEVITSTDLPPGLRSDVLILHLDRQYDGFSDLLANRRERVVAVFHNMFIENKANKGLDDVLMRLKNVKPEKLCLVVFTLDQADYLLSVGFRDVRIAARGSDPGRLLQQEFNAAFAEDVKSLFPDGFLLMVADFTPENRIELAIQTMHLIRTVHRLNVGIVVLSGRQDDDYRRSIDEYSSRFPEVNTLFLGPVSESGIATLFRTALAYLGTSNCDMSAHRQLQAMAFGCPVVTLERESNRDLLRTAAIVLPADAGPMMFSEALDRLVRDDTLRGRLRDRGRFLAQRLSTAESTSSVSSIIRDFVS